MKKVLLIALVVMLVLAFAGCSFAPLPVTIVVSGADCFATISDVDVNVLPVSAGENNTTVLSEEEIEFSTEWKVRAGDEMKVIGEETVLSPGSYYELYVTYDAGTSNVNAVSVDVLGYNTKVLSTQPASDGRITTTVAVDLMIYAFLL